MGTTMNYLSSTKALYQKHLSNGNAGIFNEVQWYQTVRRTCKKKFIKHSQTTGIPLVNQADPMTIEILKDVAQETWNANSRKSIESRAFITILWQLLGRVSEVSHLREKKLLFNNTTGALEIKLIRTKGNQVGKESNKSIFLNRDFFMIAKKILI